MTNKTIENVVGFTNRKKKKKNDNRINKRWNYLRKFIIYKHIKINIFSIYKYIIINVHTPFYSND